MATGFGVYATDSGGGGYKERQQYLKHLRALKHANSKVDNKAVIDDRYLMRIKRKRQLYEDENQYQVDRQNEVLLGRLLDIKQKSGRIDNWNNSYKPVFDRNKTYRQRVRDRIDADNKKLLRRLQNSKPFYDKSEWDKGYVKHLKYLAILGKKSKPWQTRAYREAGDLTLNSPRKKQKVAKKEPEVEDSYDDEDDDETEEEDTEDDSQYSDESSERNSESEDTRDKLPEIKSATGGKSERKSISPQDKDEEPLKLPPINGEKEPEARKAEESAMEEQDDFQMLVKAIQDEDSEKVLDIIAQNAGDKAKLDELVAKYNENNEKDLVDVIKTMFKGETQDALMALLLPKPNFDAMCLYNALKGPGEDKDVVVEILGIRENAEIIELKKVYEKEYGNTLEEDIKASCSGEYQKLLLRLCEADRDNTPTANKKASLSDAKKLLKCAEENKWGTDEDGFIEILCEKSHPQIKGTLTEYKKSAKCDLEDTLDKQLNGDLLDGSKTMIKIVRNRPKYFAHKLHEALHDEDEVNYEVLSRLMNTCDEAELKAVKAAYAKAFHSTLEDDVNANCTEDVKKLLVPVLKDDGKPIDEGRKKNRKKRPSKNKKDGTEESKKDAEDGNKDNTEGNKEDGDENAEDAEQAKYHGTITPAANFDPMKDVEFVRGALVYKDKDGVIKRLTSRSNQQRQTIAKKFSIRYKQELGNLLKSEFGANLVDTIDALMLPPSVQDARTLHEGMKGLGTKENDLLGIICCRKNKELVAIKESYQQEFERDLDNDVRNETSGDFGDFLVMLLEAKRSESSKVKESDVEEDAKELFAAGEDKLGTNEETICEILTSRSRPHLNAVFEEYEKIANRDFMESMMSEISGDLLKAVIAVVCFMTEPTHYFAEIINKMISDDKALTKFIASRSEIDMVEIKEAYKECSNHELAEDVRRKHKGNRRKILLGLIKEEEGNATKGSKNAKKKKGKSKGGEESSAHPTVISAKHFSSNRDAELIRISLAVDKDAIIMLLAARGNKQRQEILQKYQDMYKKNLLEDLSKIFGSGSENILKPLFVSPDIFEATMLKESMEGMGTDEDLLMSSICLRENEDIGKLKEAFQNVSGKDLSDVVRSETSGDFRTLLMRLLEGKRDESDSFDQTVAQQDAAALHEAGEKKKFGTDESKFIEVFTSRSKASLKAIFDEYKKIANCDIVDSLRGELNGNFEKAMILLANNAQVTPAKLYSNYLHRVVDIPREFPYCISTRAEIDMVEIKTAYHEEFKETLVDEIMKRYSDDQMNLLLALIKEWKQGRKDITQPPGKAAESKYHPTVLPASNFDALSDADSIYATQSSEFDMDEVVILLVRRTVEQRKEIVKQYKEKYEKDLIKELQTELDMEPSLLNALFEDPGNSMVEKLQNSTKGTGTDEKALMEVVCTKTNKELEGIKRAYFEACNEDINEVVTKETSGQFRDLLLKILKLERNESPEVSTKDANEDAKALYKAGEERWGTDENEFVDIFATRSRPHLRAVFKEFKKIAKRDITESLNAELSGDLLEALLLIVSVSYQNELTSTTANLNGKLTEKNGFTCLVVAHSEIDMVEVKEEYKKENKVSLADDIKKNYEGNHQKILLGLIKEWKPFAKGLANSKKEDKKPEKQYHATVTEALNFNAVKDADTLYEAKGKDINVTIMLLATRTKDQRLKIKEEYEKKYNSNLLEDLSEELKLKIGNLEPLFLKHETWLSHRLHDAMKGFGTDETTLIDILCIQDNENLKALKTAYKDEFDKDLAEVIGDETGGELKEFLLEILKADRRENQPASEKQAVSDATSLYEAGEKKWGTDESKFIKVLTTRSRTHLKQVFVEYKKIANRDLIESLKDEMDGDLEYALITLVSFIQKEQLTYSSEYLKESLDNPRTFIGYLSDRAETDTVEIKEKYSKTYSTTLDSDINQNFSGNFASLLLSLIKEWNPKPKQNSKKKGTTKKSSTTDGAFHGTVTPVKPFNPVKDCEAIRKAIGKDKKTLIDILSSRTIEQRQTIQTKYKERYNKANLLKALKEDFAGELDDVISALFVKTILRDIRMLNEALKGTEVKEDVIYKILCQRNEEELQNIKQEFKKVNGHPLSTKIGELTAGDLKTLLLGILKCERSDVQSVDQKMAEKDAQGLHEKGENNSSAAIIDIFTTRSTPQIVSLLEAYKKLSSKDELRDDLLDSANASKALVMLASFLQEPQLHAAKEIKKAVCEDAKYCEKLITRHCEIDLVEIKDIYETFDSQTLDEDITKNYSENLQGILLGLVNERTEVETKDQKEFHPTVLPAKDCNPKADSESLKKGQGTENDVDGMIALICSRTKLQRNKIKDEYLKKNNADLLQDLCAKLKVKERYIKILFADNSSGKAKMLHEAMKGFGTDEGVLINILCTENNEGLNNIKMFYKKDFEKELAEMVETETSGDLQSLLLKILKGDRNENQAANTSKAKADAKTLYEAGVKKSGTDESKFVDILVSRSRIQLQKVFKEYRKIANQEIEQSIKGEMSGDLEDSLLALVSSVRQDPEKHWSSHLNQSINKPQEMFECVAERSEIDMVEIKEEYKNTFNVTLADDIKKNYSGNMSKILLALIKEFNFSPKPPPTKAAQRTTKGRATKVSRTANTPPPTKVTPSLFHGTVVSAKEFDVNKDVKTFHSSFGNDKEAIILLLSTRSNAQRQPTVTKYKETHKKDLVNTLNEEFQLKPENFIRSLFITPAANDAMLLQEAMEGLGTKENDLIHVLCQRSEEEILEIKNQYKQAYKKSLDDSIDSETSGDFGRLLLEILKCDRDDSTVVDGKMVEAEVKGLYEAGEKKSGANKDKFIETLTSRSHAHLTEVFKEYDKISEQGFEKVIETEFSGDVGKAVLTLASCTKNPLVHYVKRLRETVDEDASTFSRLVVERCEIDMVEIKELYLQSFNTNLSDDIKKHYEEPLQSFLLALIKEDWSASQKSEIDIQEIPPIVYHATVVPTPNLVAGNDVNNINGQLEKDKNAVVDVLTTRTKAQRHIISEEYQKQEKEDLLKTLVREFGEESEDMLSLLMQPTLSDSEKLHDAMEGLGTKENVLIEVLCPRTVQEITAIKSDYKKVYEKDLDEIVEKETSGDFNKLLMQVIKCERVEANTVDKRQIERDATELHDAGEKKTGTDESKFIDIFAIRSWQHLKLLFEQYKKVSGKAIEETIHKEFSGDIEAALMNLVSHANNSLTRYVAQLNETIKDDSNMFCQLVVERSEVDMVEIKELYEKTHGVTLADDIRKHYSGDVKNILLALINEWSLEERKPEPTVPIPPPAVFHATVENWPNFVAENDADVVKTKLGYDNDSVVALLTTRNKIQRQDISQAYQKKENEAILENLIHDFGGESKEMLSLLMQPAKSDVEKLHDAMEGFGTKEDILIEILCRRNNEEMMTIKTEFKKNYNKDLDAMVEKETSGDFQNLLVQLIKCEREEKDVIYLKQVEQDAADLYQVGEKMSGTDESKFVTLFTSRTLPHLKLVFEQYKKISGVSIQDSLTKEFTGNTESAFLTLVSYINDPLTHHVEKLNQTIKDDPNTFCQQIVDRSEVDMVEIKELYEKTHKTTLADDIKKHYTKDVNNILLALIKEWTPEKETTISVDSPVVYHATVIVSKNFVEQDDVNAMKRHFASDRNSIVTLLTTRTKLQRQNISEAYQQKENQVFQEKLNEEFGEESKDLLSYLMHPGKSDAEELHDAMEGFGTKEDVLINIICRRSKEEIMAVKTQYKNLSGKDLDATIDSETSGDLKTLLLELIKCEREEKDVIYPKQVERDAADLYEAGEKNSGTNESLFIEIFTRRSLPHLKLLFEQYKRVSGKSIEDSLKEEFSGNTESAFVTLVSCINDPLTHHVEKLNRTIQDDPNIFYQQVVDRSEVDMVEIKEVYEKTYQTTLAEDIKKHYTDNVQNILLALIKEWTPEKEVTIPVDPPAVYHATVVTSPNFIEEDDVNALKKRFGNEKNSIIALLTTRTKNQRQNISQTYHQKENQVLQEKLAQEFGEESKDMLSWLMQPEKSDAEKLHDAMKGFGTKENVLINILCRRSKQEMMEIVKQYKNHSGTDLNETIDSETSGDLKTLLLELIKHHREEKDVIYQKQLEKDAADLYEAGEKTSGTEETRFIEIFTRRSLQHLKLLFEQYKKVSGKTIEETLQKEFSGDTESAFITLASYVRDPLTSHIVQLNATIKDDSDTFCQLVVERSEVDMVEIKELYQKNYQVTLADDIEKHYTGDVRKILLSLIKEWDPKKEQSDIHIPEAIAYHATVVGAQTFDVDDDVNTLKQSFGKDKNAILIILTTRNRKQIQEISEKYEQKHNEDLHARLTAVFGGEFSETLSHLMLPLAVTDAKVIYDAMKGFGTKEEVIIGVLCRRNQQEIEAIKTQYKKTYEQDLGEMVNDETDGDLNKLLTQLIKCERVDESAISANQVEKDANDLYEAGVKKWGTDESTFIDIFTKRSFVHLTAVFEYYKKISQNDIVHSLNSELDGHLLAAFLALVSSARNPPTYYAGLAKQTVKDSPKDFTKLVIERCEVDTVEIKDIYLSVYKKKIADDILENYNGVLQRILLGLLDEPWDKLAEDTLTKEESNPDKSTKKEPNMITVEKPVCQGTIKQAPAFDPNDYAAKLQKAMKGFGTDEKIIIQVLSSRSNEQRRVISNTYQQQYKKDLLDELKSELGGDMENVVVAMMLPNDVFYATELNKAMKGIGADEEALLEIICSQTCESLEAVTNAYKKENDVDLKASIDGETKGDVRLLLQALLLSGYLNNNQVDLNEVESVASDINKAGSKRWEGENSIFIKMLTTNGRSFMTELFKAFQKIAKSDIVEAISQETSGTYKDILLATVKCIRDPPSYFAERLHDALDRFNVDDDTLIRCVVGRSEIDLMDIKQSFQNMYSVSLESMIKKKCRGNYETMLVSIVDGIK